MLAVAADFANPLLSLVTDSCDFVGLDIGFDYLSGHLILVERGFADFRCLAADKQQRLEAKGLAGVLNKFNLNSLAFGDQVLFTTSINYCFFHHVHRSIPKNPAPVKRRSVLIFFSFGEFDCQVGAVNFNFSGEIVGIGGRLLNLLRDC